MRRELPDVILAERVIPVARGLSASTAPRLALALLEGGLSTIEVTVEGPGGLEAIASLRGVDTLVGAGTVVSTKQAEAALQAGAQFVVSPHLDRGLLDWANDRGVPMIPGAMTPTEVASAWAMAATAVKIFPASVVGPEYVRSLLGPYPDLKMIPTGGIDGANAADYLSAGAVAVGVGSWLTRHDDLAAVAERANLLRSQVV